MAALCVRYIVDDVDAAIEFYRDRLGFEVHMHPAPGFAALAKGDLRLLLNAPGAGGAGRAGGRGAGGAGGRGAGGAGGAVPEPGGWNRFQLAVDDLESTVGRLGREGARFRGDIVVGNGGSQILVEDPSGNPVELFQPA